jgi:hypothetical protein
VRQLDLDAMIPTTMAASAPATLRQVVETVVQRMASQAVSADDPAAPVAPMVYFKDDASVVLSLAQRVASNKPTTEWFWPSVVNGWTPNAPVERAIPLLVERAMTTSGGVVTLAQVVQTLASTGALDKLLERLSPADGRALLETIGWTEAMVGDRSVTTTPAATVTFPRMPARALDLVQRWVDKWGGDVRDPRAVWLGAMLLVADQPSRSTNAELPAVVKAWLASVVEAAQDGGGGEGGENGAATQAMRREDLIADARAWLQSNPRTPVDSLFGGGPPAPFTARVPFADSTPVERQPDDDADPIDEHDPDEAPTWRHPAPTNHAGFLFLVPLLTRTGLTNIVRNDPTLIARDWTTALLLRVARRLGVPWDDPAVAWITRQPKPIAHDDRALTAEVLRAARIRVRVEAQVTMRRLVHRTGAVAAARETIDVVLHRSDVDADVRRSGLDAGGELVPWLGRAVHFHYVDALDINA